MRRRGAAVVALVALCGHAAHADFAAGARAYDGGDYGFAFREWMALARAGDAMAQTAIAGMYRFGEGRPADPAEAVGWYRRAARQGDPVAQMNLGEMYVRGVGVPRDPVLGYVWMRRAARRGSDWAADRARRLVRSLTSAQRQAAAALLEGEPPRQ